MPRPYRLGQRRATADETRARVIAAARELLATSSSPGGFSIDAVAKAADVARMTVYYQFGNKAGLLQAVFDDLAAKGGMEALATAFRKPDPLEALDVFVGVFCSFWASDQVIFHRLRALAILDADLGRELAAREHWAHQGIRLLLDRIVTATGRPQPDERERVAAVLFTLTSFPTFDGLQRELGMQADEIADILRQLARCALGQA